MNVYGQGVFTIVEISHPAESKTNSTVADQDFTSRYSIPTSYLEENKAVKVTVILQWTGGASSTATGTLYLKLGSTKVWTMNGAQNLANSQTNNNAYTFIIQGTEAAGDASDVLAAASTGAAFLSGFQLGGTTQPVAVATNTELPITLGCTFSATGSTETIVLLSSITEIVN